MNSPIEVSQISLSHSRSSGYSRPDRSHDDSRMFDVDSPSVMSAAKDFLYQRQLAPNAVPLLVRLQRFRILLTAALGASCMVVPMYFLQQGLVLTSYQVTSTEPTSATELDTYNAIVGLLTSLVVRPLLSLVTAVVPALLLCFFTQKSMQETTSTSSRVALACIGHVVLYLFLNGFMAVYVHEETARVDAVIHAKDLASNASSTVSPVYPGASVDTILRTAMQLADATAENAPGQCSRPSPRRLPAQLDYGFASRPWFRHLLPTAPAATATNTLNVSLHTGVEAAAHVAMPMPLPAARNLVALALRATDDYFRPQDGQVNTSVFELDGVPQNYDAASRDNGTMIDALVRATNATLARAVKARPHLRNVSVADARVAFVQFPWTSASGHVTFEGVTLELPLTKAYLRRQVTLRDDTTASVLYGAQALDGLFEINAKEECGRYGCMVSPVGALFGTAPVDQGSQVRALSICLDANGHEDMAATMSLDGKACAVRSTTSMLVVSFAKRIVGDAMASSTVNGSSANAVVVMLTNARKIYEVTAGRLSWATTDLAATYDASCGTSDCHGLVFPLANDAGDVVVGAAHVPVSTLSPYASSLLAWTPLVTSNAQEVDQSDMLKSDVVLPQNFHDTSGWAPVDSAHCERERGTFMDRVQSAHLYSDYSLQPAYLSAVFWLLQHGVVKQRATDSTLAFEGSVKFVDLVVAVPPLSAVLTCVGAALLVLMALAIYFGGKSREADIERHFKPHHLARILLDDEEFSHRLLKCDLLNVGNKYLNSSELLEEFEISGLALRHRTRPSDVLIVPNAHLASTRSAPSATQAAHVV